MLSGSCLRGVPWLRIAKCKRHEGLWCVHSIMLWYLIGNVKEEDMVQCVVSSVNMGTSMWTHDMYMCVHTHMSDLAAHPPREHKSTNFM